MNDHLFDKLIKEKADGHEASVPPDAWPNIERQKKKRRNRFFWWTFGMLLLLGFALLGIYNRNSGSDHPETLTAEIGNAPVEAGNQTQQHTAAVREENTPSAKKSTSPKPEKHIDPQNLGKTNDGNVSVKGSTNNTNNVKNNIISKDNRIIKAENNQHGTSFFTINKRPNKKYQGAIDTIADADKKIYSTDETARRYKKTSGKNRFNASITNGTLAEEALAEDSVSPISALGPKENKITEQLKQNNSVDSVTQIKQFAIKKADSTVTATYTNVPKKEKVSKRPVLMFDFSISSFIPIIGSNRLTALNRTTVTPSEVATFSASDIRINPELSFSYTLALRKKITPRIWLGTGLQYSIVKENIYLSGKETHTSLSHIQRLEVSNGTPVLVEDTISITSSGTRTINAVNSYRFISVPVSVQYELYKKNNWSLLLAGSVYFNVNSNYSNSISGSLTKQYSSGNTPGENGNKLSADLYTGIRIARNFGKYALFAEPYVQYNLIKYDIPGALNNNRVHRTGVALGISWQPVR